MRAASGPIDGEGAWSTAPYLSPDESVPGAFGTWGAGHVEGLLPCNTYHFAVRALDDNGHPSGFHGAVTCQTFGPGCGG